MSFVEELISKIEAAIDRDCSSFHPTFNDKKDKVSDLTTHVLANIQDIVNDCLHRLYLGTLNNNEINGKVSRFLDPSSGNYTNEVLAKFYELRRGSFTDDEKRYIKYTKLTKTWNGEFSHSFSETYAILDVLFKYNLRSEVDLVFSQKRQSIMEDSSLDDVDKKARLAELEKQRISELEYIDKRFPLLVDEQQYRDTLHSSALSTFDNSVNCGSYALEIDQPIYPFGYTDVNKNVSCILNNFPFVRLLGDSQLKDDEYMVLYKANSAGYGHHFVKVDETGKLTEKDGSKPVGDFTDWSKNLDSDVAVFAVKKKHNNFGYHQNDIRQYSTKDVCFSDSLSRAIAARQNFFSYRGTKYSLKKDEHGAIIVVANGQLVATSLKDKDHLSLTFAEGQEARINKLSPKNPLQIVNGVITNYSDYLSRKDIDK
jgi:hypothetical protein